MVSSQSQRLSVWYKLSGALGAPRQSERLSAHGERAASLLFVVRTLVRLRERHETPGLAKAGVSLTTPEGPNNP